MTEFFEPEDEFKIEKIKRENIKTKISSLILLVVFGSTIILAIQFNFINIFEKEKIKITCLENNTYSRIDENEMKTIKAKKVLRDHLETIKELNGFLETNIDFEEINQKNRKPVLNFVFKKTSVDKSKIPVKICGFRTTINIK